MKASSARRRTTKGKKKADKRRTQKETKKQQERREVVDRLTARSDEYYEDVQEAVKRQADRGRRKAIVTNDWLKDDYSALERETYADLMQGRLEEDGYEVKLSYRSEGRNYSDDYGRLHFDVLDMTITW